MTVPAPQTAVLTEKRASTKLISGIFAITVITISTLAAMAIYDIDSAMLRGLGYVTFLGALVIAASIFIGALLLSLRQPQIVVHLCQKNEASAPQDDVAVPENEA
jgi:hypothetical protein